MAINKVDITYYSNGEDITQLVLNRPLEQLETNIDNLITLVNEADPFPQYATDDEALAYAIALG